MPGGAAGEDRAGGTWSDGEGRQGAGKGSICHVEEQRTKETSRLPFCIGFPFLLQWHTVSAQQRWGIEGRPVVTTGILKHDEQSFFLFKINFL